ncbi:hypothetical protein ACS7SF_09225 [Ralstonia sp. 25C]
MPTIHATIGIQSHAGMRQKSFLSRERKWLLDCSFIGFEWAIAGILNG